MTLIVVRSVAGRDVCTVQVRGSDRVSVLARRARLELGVRRCKILSIAGVELALETAIEASNLLDGDVVTVVPLMSPATVFGSIFSGSTAVVKEDASVNYWDDMSSSAQSPVVWAELGNSVRQVAGTATAVAVLKKDGSVITWGDPDFGGDSSAVQAELAAGVREIVGNLAAFAAVKEDGSVVQWGHFPGEDAEDGEEDPRAAIPRAVVQDQIGSGVRNISVTANAFAALRHDGSVITWGRAAKGGDSSRVQAQLTSGVQQVAGAYETFVAVKDDGSLITWGADLASNAGDVQAKLAGGVCEIVANQYAFAALKGDGSVVSWGLAEFGGDSSAVAAQISSGVVQIAARKSAFAALKDDGTVVSWGLGSNLGIKSVEAEVCGGVVQIAANWNCFVAVKEEGTIVTWREILDDED
eukprot:TRINITY_DN29115_c0_g1_i1.p1 TRINITY_DN29115_c0_g1~~TRINITY_DN29115_c0_g1_i1.p1  ORF type:complete len:428 (-),score=70.10 TRINITY_DN29115_c0_g1_i1:55-1293(-)